jgi:hypothetical protein
MHNLGIIVPYRDREQHLKKFIPHINLFLKDKLKFTILVVEQHDNNTFNRGKLKNIGFDILKNECNYYCFHDVDQLPASQECDYSYSEDAVRLATSFSQFNFSKRPVQELGGVVIFNRSNFEKVNGFSNNYIGWGLEDNDLGLRCIRKNINIIGRNGLYLSLPHKSEGDTLGGIPSKELLRNRELFSEVSKDDNKLFSSGLSNLSYLIEVDNNYPLYRHVKVKYE